jgi:8-oxo-dGTP pyrophosphatase MutT (NUDIX family)
MGTEKSAGIVLFRNDASKNEFLLLNYPQGHWDFVKGKVEQNETPHETALRETKEETGITNIEFIDGFEESVEYDFRFKKEDIQLTDAPDNPQIGNVIVEVFPYHLDIARVRTIRNSSFISGTIMTVELKSDAEGNYID